MYLHVKLSCIVMYSHVSPTLNQTNQSNKHLLTRLCFVLNMIGRVCGNSVCAGCHQCVTIYGASESIGVWMGSNGDVRHISYHQNWLFLFSFFRNFFVFTSDALFLVIFLTGGLEFDTIESWSLTFTQGILCLIMIIFIIDTRAMIRREVSWSVQDHYNYVLHSVQLINARVASLVFPRI